MNYLKLFGLAAFAIGAILYLASADDHEVVVGDQTFDLGEYSKISVNTAADLKVNVGGDYGMNITADEKDLKNLKIYVKGQTLVIENKQRFFNKWHGDKLTIAVDMPKLKKFTLNGASDATISGLHGDLFKVVVNGSGNVDFEGATDELKAEVNGSGSLKSRSYEAGESSLEINGSGEVVFAGACRTLKIDINGSGDFDGKDFKCRRVEVDVVGSGDLEVYASEAIDVDVMGSGDVVVYGNPKDVRDQSRKKNHVTVH